LSECCEDRCECVVGHQGSNLLLAEKESQESYL
jgi:hypothetical protein